MMGHSEACPICGRQDGTHGSMCTGPHREMGRSGSRIGLALLALERRCRDDDSWPLSRWDRLRLTAKAVFCILLLPERRIGWESDMVIVAMYDGHSWSGPDGYAAGWSQIELCLGWRDWRWCNGSDGV